MAPKDIDRVEPALAVFGLDGSKKAHGSYFAPEEVDRAIKAAHDMGMFAIRVAGNELMSLARTLPRGKLFDSGAAFVPFVAMATHAKLMAIADAAGDRLLRPTVLLVDRPAKPKTKAAGGPTVATKTEPLPPLPHRAPADWTTIGVGSLVLAADDEADGFYHAIVVAVDDQKKGSDREVVLQFQAYPEYVRLTRKVAELALLHPSVNREPEAKQG